MKSRNHRCHSDSILCRSLAPVSLAAVLILVGCVSPRSASSAQVVGSESQQVEDCGLPEECFAAAVWPKERLGNTLRKDQVLALKLERLRRVMEQFPDSLWAKRAGLLSGVMLIDKNPASALPYLRIAQQQFPVLDDYVRFWMGEALLRQGEAKEAALVYEGIAQSVPDSNLVSLVALRAGESWYQASSCPEAVVWLTKAVSLNDKDVGASQAWLRLADCQIRNGQPADARETLKKLWAKFPQTKEAKEAEALLATKIGGEAWTPQPDDLFARAQVFLGQALHAEAIDELKRFLAREPAASRRGEAKLKRGIAQVRLKLYDQARETFQELAGEQTAQSNEAFVWLARVYLRQGLGEKLLELNRAAGKRSLSSEQKGQINLFAGIWLEDQAQFDEAVEKYRQVARYGEPASQRAEAQWREGWVLYRTGRYHGAVEVWQHIVDQRDSEFEPQALYWIARSHGRNGRVKSLDLFQLLCKRYPYTYYCQLAQGQTDLSSVASSGTVKALEHSAVVTVADPSPVDIMVQEPVRQDESRREIEQQPAYQRAVELRTLGFEQDAARELTALTDRYSHDPNVLTALSVLLNEVGAYHHALRLVRARFRDRLERTGGSVADSLWTVAYPTGLLRAIKTQGVEGVDPFLVAAIIREESQYDRRAVSRVGAIGLMQIMPATANAVAQRHRLPGVVREDLFDQDTNIQIGVRYVQQLLAQFSGNVVQAIAAYNAGPIAVESWATMYRGRSEDEFVELIPFQETRQYVKRVLRSYKEYVRLAGAAKPVS
jgi:soluble lytic murein transglycosylase